MGDQCTRLFFFVFGLLFFPSNSWQPPNTLHMFDKLKSLVHEPLPAAKVCTGEPTRQQILRYRRQFGVNFGSLFLQEKFIFDRFFGPYGTEFEGMSQYLSDHGLEQTKQDLEQHWRSYANDDDWHWLKDHGVTTIRVPLGYWHVGEQFTTGTPFEKLARVYKAAWPVFKELVQKANEYDIGVIFDLHSLPGGANTAEHSGIPLKAAGFWTSHPYQTLALELLSFVAQELKPFENVTGIQVVNEAEFSNDAKHQKRYYSNVIKTIRAIDHSVPLIISDGWWTGQWCEWVQKNCPSGVIIDAHVYRCFSDSDKNKSAERITNDLDDDCLKDVTVDVIVGEYSCVLDGQTWDKGGDRDQLVKRYGQKQSQLFHQRALGSFFWTYKFQHGDGGEWGFRPMVERGCVGAYKVEIGGDLDKLYAEHCQYWDSQGGNYEHWRYKDGFTRGQRDAEAFAKFGSAVGSRAWIQSRLHEHIKEKGKGQVWEWEQGYKRAVGL